MRCLAALTLALLAAGAAHGAAAHDAGSMASLLDRFEAFKSKHGRKYTSDRDEATAFTNYVANTKAAAALSKANPLARFGDNEYADVSAADFKTMHNAERYLESELQRRSQRKQAAVFIGSSAQGSSHVDWRKRGAVTYVKNQGLKCGSCWSFSTTGNIEGQWFLAGNSLVALSEQELVSCDTTNGGCHGGLMDNAFEWLVSTRGGNISTEVAYPYVSANGYVPACGASGSGSAASGSSSSGGLDAQAVQAPPAFVTGATITGHHDLPSNEQQMGQWMLTGGPISIAVDATSWQLYQGGIMTNCISDKLDHAVLAVGFDDTNNPPYWIVKNSWGASWGESGFIRVQKGTNQCLINSAPTTSIVTKSGPVPPAPPVPTTVAPSPTSPPPPPSPTTPPTPPAANGTFTQYQCSDAACQQNCNGQTFLQDSCLTVQGGGSAIAVCGAQGITLTYYANVSDCTGSSQQQLIPLDQCVADGAGTYSYDTCQGSSSNGGSSSAGGNGQLLAASSSSALLRLHPAAAHRLRNRKYHGRH